VPMVVVVYAAQPLATHRQKSERRGCEGTSFACLASFAGHVPAWQMCRGRDSDVMELSKRRRQDRPRSSMRSAAEPDNDLRAAR